MSAPWHGFQHWIWDNDIRWAAIVTSVGAIGGLIGVIFVWLGVREARKTLKEGERGRHAQMAAEFSRRYGEPSLVECRRMIRGFAKRADLRNAMEKYQDANSAEYYILVRELDFFEDLGIAWKTGTIDFEYIVLGLDELIVSRRHVWQPTIDWFNDDQPGDIYANFCELADAVKAWQKKRGKVMTPRSTSVRGPSA